MANKRSRKRRTRKKTVLVARADIVLFAFFGCCAVFLLIISASAQKTSLQEPRLEILRGNQIYGTYPLSWNRTIRIGKGNVCEIRDGAVKMIEADCPDQICVHTKEITKKGGSIVCLPNHIVLRITDADEEEREVDTIAG